MLLQIQGRGRAQFLKAFMLSTLKPLGRINFPEVFLEIHHNFITIPPSCYYYRYYWILESSHRPPVLTDDFNLNRRYIRLLAAFYMQLVVPEAKVCQAIALSFADLLWYNLSSSLSLHLRILQAHAYLEPLRSAPTSIIVLTSDEKYKMTTLVWSLLPNSKREGIASSNNDFFTFQGECVRDLQSGMMVHTYSLKFTYILLFGIVIS